LQWSANERKIYHRYVYNKTEKETTYKRAKQEKGYKKNIAGRGTRLLNTAVRILNLIVIDV